MDEDAIYSFRQLFPTSFDMLAVSHNNSAATYDHHNLLIRTGLYIGATDGTLPPVNGK